VGASTKIIAVETASPEEMFARDREPGRTGRVRV
jgi:hypothetical protein